MQNKIIIKYLSHLFIGEPWVPLLGDLAKDLVGDLVGDPEGELPLIGEFPLIGEPSLTSFPTSVFYTATLSENFFSGSFLSIFSSSAGVY